MAAGSYNILIEQGATYDQTFTMTRDGSPVNLTGYTARMQFRVSAATSSITFDVATSGTFTLGGALGTIRVQISATATSGIVAGTYVYDLEIQSGTGVVTRLLQGQVVVSPEVTR